MNEQNEVNSDRELLQYAAKAAGLMTDGWHRDGGLAAWMPGQESKYWFNWDPFTSDADAFRLAVKLKLIVTFADGGAGPHVCAGQRLGPFSNEKLPIKMFALDEELAATRRAIVRAAAEIGRNMV